MPEALVVRLLSSAAEASVPAEWLALDSAGQPAGAVESGALTDAVAHVVGRKLIVLVPGTDTLLAEPVLPLKGGAKLAQVVPFALEEQLGSDVETVHFAVGKREGRPGTPVAAVAHARMEAWRAMFAESGLQPEAIYPETAVLPVTANAVTLLIDGPRVYVRREDKPGAVLEVEPLVDALQLALAAGEETREHVTIYLSEADYEREREMLEGLRESTASLQLKLLPEGPLPLLAVNASRGTSLNLLQGPYLVKKKLNISFAPWRYAAVLALLFLGTHMGLRGWQYFHYRAAEADLDQQIATAFQQAMPGMPVPDPLQARAVVEARLKQLRGSGPVGGMMTTLAMLGEALAEAPGAAIEALSYRNDTTDLRVLAPSVDELERIRQVASEHGVSARLEAATPRDSKFEGRLQFKAGA